MGSSGPEAKAAQEIANASPEHEAGPPAGATERIILRANAAHYLPLLRKVCEFDCPSYCPDCPIHEEIARLEGAEK